MSEVRVTPLNKDIDVLPGLDRKQLKPSLVNVLEQRVSVQEAFDAPKVGSLGGSADSVVGTSLAARWSKYKAYCLASFQTRAADFAKTDISILFSKRVRDRLAELAVTTDEAQLITMMQQNEEGLRSQIKQQSVELERLHKESQHWEMIELISKSCELLVNTKSPQFYPAQFTLVLDLVEAFGKMVYDRINSQPMPKGDFLKEKEATKPLLALNWSMILCRTSHLLPRLLLQIAFLRSMKFHPFKTIEETIRQIAAAIPGLGTASAGIYTRAYFAYTVFTNFPETSCDLMLPLFTTYTRSVLHFKTGAFQRQLGIIDYTFGKYMETHAPALGFFLSVMVSVGDAQFLRGALDEFYGVGVPSSFILSSMLDELQPKFVAKIYSVLLVLIDKSDDVIAHPTLIHKLITSLTASNLSDGILELMNDIWNRMREFTDVEDFVYVAAPMTAFIAKFCAAHYLNLFISNVVQLLRRNFAGRRDDNRAQAVVRSALSKKLTACVSACITAVVEQGANFSEVLRDAGSIVDLMDFLSEDALVHVSRVILEDVAKKQFELSDPLCIRILLELSQIVFQSLSVLSPTDVIEKSTKTIEWFLYRVDFGANIEAHLNFLLSAREAFPTGTRLLAAIALIGIRLTAWVSARKPPNHDVICHSLLAFSFVTMPSIPDPIERARLWLQGANAALGCNVICFAISFFDEFLDTMKNAPANALAYKLYLQALSFLLLCPSRPSDEDPFEAFKQLVVQAFRKDWPDDEAVRFALEALVLLSHALRSEYVMRVPEVDSNDVLYAGSAVFREKGLSLIGSLLPKFIASLQQFKQKGVMAAKSKVPALALKAIAVLPDVYAADDVLFSQLKVLANMTQGGDSRVFQAQKKQAVAHLAKVFAENPTGMQFLKVFAGS
jgi:hypothetical protein